jgi:hypothetical protein
MPGKRRFARPAALAAVAAGILGVSVYAGTAVNGQASGPPAPGIERAEADALLARTVQLAQAGDFAGLCQAVAPSAGPCRSLLDYTKSQDWLPGTSTPAVTNARRYPASSQSPETLVLHVTGVRFDGSRYETDFPVIRTDTGDVKSVTPVYWSGMKFASPQLTCGQVGEACAAVQAPGPHTGP